MAEIPHTTMESSCLQLWAAINYGGFAIWRLVVWAIWLSRKVLDGLSWDCDYPGGEDEGSHAESPPGGLEVLL